MLLLLAILLPLALLFLRPAGGLLSGGWSFWLVLGLSFWLIWALMGRHRLAPNEQPEPVREVMDIRLATEEGGAKLFRGKLRNPQRWRMKSCAAPRRPPASARPAWPRRQAT